MYDRRRVWRTSRERHSAAFQAALRQLLMEMAAKMTIGAMAAELVQVAQFLKDLEADRD